LSRWFHPNITGIEAEQLLLTRGVHGSFLARPSKSNPGDFTLSVRRNDEVTHIKIQNSGDYYDLYGGEKFATLAELVQYYTEQHDLLREKSGDIIELKYPLNCKDPTSERYGPAEWLVLTFLLTASDGAPADLLIPADRPESRGGQCECDSQLRPTEPEEEEERKSRGSFDNASPTSRRPPCSEGSAEERGVGELMMKGPVGVLVRIDNSTFPQGPVQSHAVRQFQDERPGVALLERLDCRSQYPCRKTEPKVVPSIPSNQSHPFDLLVDTTRVILKEVDPEVPGSDYINANYIQSVQDDGRLVGVSKMYIATQGCLQNTVEDFWKMVYQENTHVIVMTTKELERGRNKCVRYWPDCDCSQDFGRVCVRNVEERPAQDYILRILNVTHLDRNEPPRYIWHYQYLSWPDHGVPNEPGGVLSFLDQVNRAQNSVQDTGPIVVHCSAGIGRTGTIIVIDILIDIINRQGLDCDIDIPKTIQMVRCQRSGMVQTEAQYKFIYMAVQQYIDTVQKRLEEEQRNKTKEREYSNIRYPPTENAKQKPGVPASQTPPMVYDDSASVYENLNIKKPKASGISNARR
uniref:protein-tyrosine-phosphatase n=1 Tax=Lepisosteus oculatus TaxID=7918 RepID=W5MKJ4_LEPOC